MRPGAATLLLVETWRCPHCGTVQTDGARCWACSRHPRACGTCRHFVRAVAGQLAYCALDRTRAVLQGDEIRACWQEAARPEPFEGLFRDLTPDLFVRGSQAVAVQDPGTRPFRTAGDPGTRSWAVPVVADPMPQPRATDGLRDAAYVPARSIAHQPPRSPGEPRSVDAELPGIAEHTAIGQRDPNGDHTAIGRRLPGDPDP